VPTVVVIPVKSFRLGKQRLAAALDEAARSRLGRALATHVAETVEEAGLLAIFVTGDPEVAAWATMTGFPSLPDPGQGLNAAAAAGAEWADQSNSSWIVLHSDLPLLQAEDLRVLADTRTDVIAPSSDGGTSAISAGRSIEFAFGPASFHKHLTRLVSPRIVVRPGLLLDIDSPADLSSALSHPRGRWMRMALS
jgi:2-phospho-L-lactate/phosphoenolpyruvate guanylyltransferase